MRFAAKVWIFYAWMIPFTLGGVASPALNAIMSHSVPATEQGELQGATSSITSLTSVIAMWAMPTLVRVVHRQRRADLLSGRVFFRGGALRGRCVAVVRAARCGADDD